MGKRPEDDAEAAGVAPTEAAPSLGTETRPSLVSMIACPKCQVMTPVARFCTDCGEALAPRRFCSDCGVSLKPGAITCGACGTKVP
jgi:hypothetical protein